MYLQIEDYEQYGTRRLRDPDVIAMLGDDDVDRETVDASDASAILDDPTEADVVFNDDGRARVQADVGELLAEKYDHITIAERESQSASAGEESD